MSLDYVDEPAEELPEDRDRVPKLIGYDAECGNFLLGSKGGAIVSHAPAYAKYYDAPYAKTEFYGATGFKGGSDDAAATALLEQIDGISTNLAKRRDAKLRKKASKMAKKAAYGGDLSYGMWYRGYGRKWLTNGGCAYIDCQKLELCTPIVRSAMDHVKYAHSMFRIARRALDMARSDGKNVQVLLNNSDGHGNSWGTHVNVLVTRRCWENIFHRKLQYLLYLASYQVSSVIFTGQGKVGAEDETPWVDYQLSQRADFFKVIVGEQTTYNRPLVNSRDESLCSKDSGLARLHCIFYDQNLCHTASFLKVGVLQIILAMIEAEVMDPNLLLDDPLDSVMTISRDTTLRAGVRTAGGRLMTAVDLQFGFLAAAKAFAATGGLDDVVPMHAEIISTWEETLGMLRDGDMEGLAPRLDWVLKKLAIERAMDQGGFGWESDEAKKLDHKYSDLAEGLYFAYEEAGVTDQVVSGEDIDLAMSEAPIDTRSWLAGEMLRMSAGGEVDLTDANWDGLSFSFPREDKASISCELGIGDPLGHTMADCRPILDGPGTIEEKLAKLGMTEKSWGYSYKYGSGSLYSNTGLSDGYDSYDRARPAGPEAGGLL